MGVTFLGIATPSRISLFPVCLLALAIKIVCLPGPEFSSIANGKFAVYDQARCASGFEANIKDRRDSPPLVDELKMLITQERKREPRPTDLPAQLDPESTSITETPSDWINRFGDTKPEKDYTLEEITPDVKASTGRTKLGIRQNIHSQSERAVRRIYVASHANNIGLEKEHQIRLHELARKIYNDFNAANIGAYYPNWRQRIGYESIFRVFQKRYESLVSRTLKNIETSSTLLQNWELFTTSRATSEALSLMYLMNDYLVGVLASLERHRMLTPKLISRILNERTEGRLLSNWVIGQHPINDNAARMYFMSDLKMDMILSPSTRLIHGLLKHLKPNTWRNIEHLHLDYQIAKFASLSDIKSLGSEFMRLTRSGAKRGSKESIYQEQVQVFLQDLTGQLFAKSLYPTQAMEEQLLERGKVLYGMLHYIVQHHVQTSDLSVVYIDKIQGFEDYRKIRALEEAIKSYTISLQHAHAIVVRSLLRLPEGSKFFSAHASNIIKNNFLAHKNWFQATAFSKDKNELIFGTKPRRYTWLDTLKNDSDRTIETPEIISILAERHLKLRTAIRASSGTGTPEEKIVELESQLGINSSLLS
ncbi:hypothetical protein PSTT_03943 [Puccinia striiformis]|uniref:Uncharacterized protein n=1 Tax=Puccinia striiformis TaxID=27350 RepID=A0A2S4VUP3_9BASI|nr:hypothetical protein PSTT_03943 [Puccinia striiformis]